MGVDERTRLVLALCAGFTVEASDGTVGVVETPLFPPDETIPDFLVIRVGSRSPFRRPILPAALVEHVDLERRAVRVGCSGAAVARLPEHLPIAI